MPAIPPPHLPHHPPAAQVRRAEGHVGASDAGPLPAWRARPVTSAASHGLQLSPLSLHTGLLQALQRHPEAASRLAGNFDFQVQPTEAAAPGWLQADPLLRVVALDAIDGVFLLHRLRGEVVYVSREGTAGAVAGSLGEWLHTLLAVPFWRDLLEHSQHGQLAQMRRAAPWLSRRERAEVPTFDADSALLRRALHLDLADLDPADAIEHLHQAVAHLPRPAVQVDGRPCGGLFGALSADALIPALAPRLG